MRNTPMTDREAAQDYLFGVVQDRIKQLRTKRASGVDEYKINNAEADELQDILDHYVLIEYEEWERMQRP